MKTTTILTTILFLSTLIAAGQTKDAKATALLDEVSKKAKEWLKTLRDLVAANRHLL